MTTTSNLEPHGTPHSCEVAVWLMPATDKEMLREREQIA